MGSKNQPKVHQSDEWLTAEDVENDLWAFSEFTHYQDFEPAPPKTILEWRNRKGQNNSKSIFDTEMPEDVEYFISGRGRAIPNRIVRPGEHVLPHAREKDEIRKKIRETSGVGYQNNIIEQTLAKSRRFPGGMGDQDMNDKLELCDASESSSGTSTPQTLHSAKSTPPRMSPAPRTSPLQANSLIKPQYAEWSANSNQSLDIKSEEAFPPLKNKNEAKATFPPFKSKKPQKQ